MIDLNIVWFFLVVILLIGYAILDGFDLGIGSLFFALGKTDEEKRILLHSIGPVWNGNEVWLLTGAGAIFAAFPFVYATVFSGFYLAMMLVLFALIFRAVAIEYYFRTEDDKKLQKLMEKLFFIGSFIPALLFGVAVGNVVVGIEIDELQNYVGTFFDLLNPYALILGVVGLCGFMLQGSTYAMLKTEGDLQERAINFSKKLVPITLVVWLIGTIATYIFAPHMFTNYTNYWILFIVPLLTLIALVAIPTFIKKKRYGWTFISSSAVIFTKVLTLAIGLFPNIVIATDPSKNLTIYNASSSDLTLKVMLIIALIGMPIVIAYTSYVYYVFHGKTSSDQAGY